MGEHDYERIAKIEKRVDEVLDHAERVLKNAGRFSDLNLDTISKWQDANDARYEQMREAHNGLNKHVEGFQDTYNKHLMSHQRTDDRLNTIDHIANHNINGARQQHWLIVGAIALAAFALGRQS